MSLTILYSVHHKIRMFLDRHGNSHRCTCSRRPIDVQTAARECGSFAHSHYSERLTIDNPRVSEADSVVGDSKCDSVAFLLEPYFNLPCLRMSCNVCQRLLKYAEECSRLRGFDRKRFGREV